MIGGWLAKLTNLDLRVEESQSLDLCFGPMIQVWVWDLFNYKRKSPLPHQIMDYHAKVMLLKSFSILLSYSLKHLVQASCYCCIESCPSWA